MKATTDALDELVNDPRLNAEVSARISDDFEADVPMFAGYEDQAREIIEGEYGLEIVDEIQMSGTRFARVIDGNGGSVDSVETDMNADEAISMF